MRKNQHEILLSLMNKLKYLNIDIKYALNYPWVYITYINDKRVTDLYRGHSGFTIGFFKGNDFNIETFDIDETFKLIRKYIKLTRRKMIWQKIKLLFQKN